MEPTREQILAEPAGPRLNAWVAEYVLGWVDVDPQAVWAEWGHADRVGDEWCWSRERAPLPRGTGKLSERNATVPYPRFSENMAAAWEIVEAMEKRSTFALKNGFMLMKDAGPWYCEFPKPWEGASGDTPAHAICRASLLSVLSNGTPR